LRPALLRPTSRGAARNLLWNFFNANPAPSID
jgi:hypothetical protein